jgi:hypothetical protein
MAPRTPSLAAMANWLHDLEQTVPGILSATGLAALTAALVLLACGWPWRRPNRVRATLGWALGVGLGFALACLVVGVPVSWPPHRDQGRLLMVIWPAVVLVECLAAVPRVPRWLGPDARLVLATSVAPAMLYGTVYLADHAGPGSAEWTVGQALAWLSGLAAALSVVWIALALLAERAPGPSLPFALALTCAGTAATIMYSGYATGGALGLPLAAALAGAAAGALLLVKPEGSRAALGVGLVGLVALLVAGRFLADLTTLHAALLLFAPVLCWLPELPGLRRLRTWQRGVLRIALVLIPVVICVVQAREDAARREGPRLSRDEEL